MMIDVGGYRRAVAFARGFLEANAPQSMTRAVALMCGMTGCVVALAGALMSKRPHITMPDVAMVHELMIGTGLLIGGGAVSLLVRSKTEPAKPEAGDKG